MEDLKDQNNLLKKNKEKRRGSGDKQNSQSLKPSLGFHASPCIRVPF